MNTLAAERTIHHIELSSDQDDAGRSTGLPLSTDESPARRGGRHLCRRFQCFPYMMDDCRCRPRPLQGRTVNGFLLGVKEETADAPEELFFIKIFEYGPVFFHDRGTL